MPVVLSVFASQDMRKQTEFDICHLTSSYMNTTVLPSCIYMLYITFCLHIREIVIKYSVLSFIHILWQLLLSIIIDRNSSTFMDCHFGMWCTFFYAINLLWSTNGEMSSAKITKEQKIKKKITTITKTYIYTMKSITRNKKIIPFALCYLAIKLKENRLKSIQVRLRILFLNYIFKF